MLAQLIDFFKQLFSPGNPEIQKDQQLKIIDARLAKTTPALCKNGIAQVALAEVLYTVYSNVGVFASLLDFIHLPEQKLVKNRVYDALIRSGYNEKTREKLESLSYEKRKQSLDAAQDRDKEMTAQMQTFMEVQKDLHTTSFAQIEKTLQDLELFFDLCSFNFVTVLKQFDAAFSPLDSKPNFAPVDCALISDELLNFYFVSAKLHLTGSLGRAIVAVSNIVPAKSGSITQDQLIARLKKVATALNRTLAPDTLKDLIMIGKRNASIEPEFSVSTATPLDEYSIRQKTLFAADTERLNMEYQDQERGREIHEVFGNIKLLSLNGYNPQANVALQEGSSFSFLWVTPMQIIKTFVATFLGEDTQALLNDIVVEGFFSIPETKTDFSSAVFESIEINNELLGFENSFSRGEKNDSVLISSYIKDSKKDPEFVRTLGNMVTEVNETAKKLTQKHSTTIYELYSLLLSILEDSRRSTPELVTNIKFLFTSSRNREIVDNLDKSLPKWAAFLNLMKHYAHLGSIGASREQKRQQDKDDHQES